MLVEVVSLIVVALTDSTSEVLDDGTDFSALMLILETNRKHVSDFSITVREKKRRPLTF